MSTFTKILVLAVGLLLLALLLSPVQVAGQSSRNFKIQSDVLDEAGSTSTSRNFRLLDAIGQPSPIGIASSARFALASGFLARGVKISASATLLLPQVQGFQEQRVDVPISVSTDSSIGFVQFVVDFDSTVIKFRDAQIGPDATGFTSIQKNPRLPFAPTTAGTNENVLVQISGGTFTGANRKVVLLNFLVAGAVGKQSPLAFDQEPTHTSLTTIRLVDLKGSALAFQNGKLTVVPNRFDISGEVTYCSAPTRAVSGVTMTLVNSEGTIATTTEASGNYQFRNILQGACKLTPSKTGDLRGAITGADALRVQRVLAFLDPPLTGCALRAADVTKDGNITGADALAILRFLAFFTTNIAFTGQWSFTPSDTSFTLSRNTTANFTALLLGDVNLSWATSTTASLAAIGKSPQTNLGSKAILALPTLRVALGANAAVPITVSTDSLIAIGQFVVNYDSTVLKYQSVQISSQLTGFGVTANTKLPFPASSTGTNKNLLVQITAPNPSQGFTGANREVVILNFLGAAAGVSTTPLVFDPDPDRTFLTTANLTDLTGNDLTFNNGQLTVPVELSSPEQPHEYALLPSYPNPLRLSDDKVEAVIRYQIPRSSRVTLRIFNAIGQEIRRLVNAEHAPGFYTARWDGTTAANRVASSGIYVIRLEAEGFVATQKFLLIR